MAALQEVLRRIHATSSYQLFLNIIYSVLLLFAIAIVAMNGSVIAALASIGNLDAALIFVGSLAVFDLLAGINIALKFALLVAKVMPASSATCWATDYILIFTITGLPINILLLSLDRYFKVVRPHAHVFDRKTAWACVAALYVAVGVYAALPAAVGWDFVSQHGGDSAIYASWPCVTAPYMTSHANVAAAEFSCTLLAIAVLYALILRRWLPTVVFLASLDGFGFSFFYVNASLLMLINVSQLCGPLIYAYRIPCIRERIYKWLQAACHAYSNILLSYVVNN
ncbi:PREDICTED: sphingosine 1-phosphate receptor 2-like [Priapulus caudatus]|uniref:Sphingosine 1-phosphate receptor 2-like n=1 Tax=Priapulus caudatus TaxID=37621 RepID=A0ABM1EHK5_PRICU|nr:PREDICTED: sphingosine 1-phosphate receptor 2-like [Priapulus caudatus]